MLWTMMFVLGVLIAILVVIAARLGKIAQHLIEMRMELGAGLGVNVDHLDGCLDGGHLTELRDYVGDRRSERRQSDARQTDSI